MSTSLSHSNWIFIKYTRNKSLHQYIPEKSKKKKLFQRYEFRGCLEVQKCLMLIKPKVTFILVLRFYLFCCVHE